MNAQNASLDPPDGASQQGPPESPTNPTAPLTSATRGHDNNKALPHTTALRRRRLQTARYLQCLASLHEEAQEMRAEIASLESIIGAQADAINALRDQISELKK